MIYQKVKKIRNFPSANESYSPMFSSLGLCTAEGENGIGALCFNYNRASRPLFDKTVSLPFPLNTKESVIYKLVFGNNEAELAFWKNDCFMLSCSGISELPLFTVKSKDTVDLWVESCDGEYLILNGFTKNRDERDPDEKTPFVIGVRAVIGKLSAENGFIAHAGAGKLLLAFAFEGLKCSAGSVRNALSIAPEDVKSASLFCRRWLRNYSRDFAPETDNEREADLVAGAIQGLLFNATRAQGNLSSYVSPFPSRGGYPAAFLWDTYFQNLGYSLLGTNLHREFLRQIASRHRTDGKFAQFLCSTWERPHDTQPALFGWAVLNAMGDDHDFAWEMLPIMESNNKWWLSARMTDRGLVYCPSGLETGQDNSPRFDNGPTIAVDMNSYLLNQLRSTAELSRVLGVEGKAKAWDELADKLSRSIMTHLYNDKDHIFYDISVATGEKVKVIGASSFLPLWAGVDIDKKKVDKMLKKYLLSPKCMFGNIPFPSVAYNDKTYNSSDWWRGPTWLPTAWLMLETLEKLGLSKDRKTAADRLYNMILADGEMHELFDSATGKGLGNRQQGWTCAIFLKLFAERHPE